MRPASAATLAIIAAGEAIIAELYDLQLSTKYGSLIYHFTDADVPITAGIYQGAMGGSGPISAPVTYQTGLTINREDLVSKIGSAGSELALKVAPQWDTPASSSVGITADSIVTADSGTVTADAGVQIAGYPFLQACRFGILDGAKLTLSKIFFSPGSVPPLVTTQGAVRWFVGIVGDVQAGRLSGTIKAGSLLSLMTVQMPRSLFQVGCTHQVYDAGCTLNQNNFLVAGTVGTVTNGFNFQTSLTQPDGYFTKAPAVITFTSGVNMGLTASVKKYLHANGQVILNTSLPTAPANGDHFTILPACDHLKNTCQNAIAANGPPFNNLIHFKGQPFVPVPETMLDGGTSNPPQQPLGYQAGAIIGSPLGSSRSLS